MKVFVPFFILFLVIFMANGQSLADKKRSSAESAYFSLNGQLIHKTNLNKETCFLLQYKPRGWFNQSRDDARLVVPWPGRSQSVGISDGTFAFGTNGRQNWRPSQKQAISN